MAGISSLYKEPEDESVPSPRPVIEPPVAEKVSVEIKDEKVNLLY